MAARDSSADKDRTARLFLTGTVTLLFAGVLLRSAGLLKSHAIVVESNGVGSQVENLRNHLQNSLSHTTKTDTGTNEASWTQIQRDLKLTFQDQPELLSHTQFIGQQFDPAARVRLLPGLDGQPGAADFDDNANGVIDDPGELGATFSDDLCIVEASHAPANLIEPSIVLQRGAYVATRKQITKPNRYPDRILVLHEGQDDAWSFVLDW